MYHSDWKLLFQHLLSPLPTGFGLRSDGKGTRVLPGPARLGGRLRRHGRQAHHQGCSGKPRLFMIRTGFLAIPS